LNETKRKLETKGGWRDQLETIFQTGAERRDNENLPEKEKRSNSDISKKRVKKKRVEEEWCAILTHFVKHSEGTLLYLKTTTTKLATIHRQVS
jgi:hypothetical protein